MVRPHHPARQTVRPIGSGRQVSQFAFDYTFYLNLIMVVVTGLMIVLHRAHVRGHAPAEGDDTGQGGVGLKRFIVYSMILVLVGGMVAWLT